MKRLRSVKDDSRGVAVAQYGLIAAVAGVALAVASLAVGATASRPLAAPTACADGARC